MAAPSKMKTRSTRAQAHAQSVWAARRSRVGVGVGVGVGVDVGVGGVPGLGDGRPYVEIPAFGGVVGMGK